MLFHGGVPSEQRGSLVARFREDPNCRVFLSTDAGGVGLNLQHAATVINMDLPWNPAVLEQRIGRVHRMGQLRHVQVVNFIAQGTIEEGMLSLLAFKKSLFAGVLDGAAAEVSLNGTRLARFMESVEKAAGAMGRAEVQAQAGAPASSEAAKAQGRDAAAATPGETEIAAARGSQGGPQPAADPWQGLVEAGAEFLSRLAALASPAGSAAQQASAPAFALETEPASGRRYLRFPVPDAETLSTLAGVLRKILPRADAD